MRTKSPIYQLGQVFGFSSQKGNLKIYSKSRQILKSHKNPGSHSLSFKRGWKSRRKERGRDQARSPRSNTSPRAGSCKARPVWGGPSPQRFSGRGGQGRGQSEREPPKGTSVSTRTNSQIIKILCQMVLEVLARGGAAVGGGGAGLPSAALLQVRRQEQPRWQEVQVAIADLHLPLAFQVSTG